MLPKKVACVPKEFRIWQTLREQGWEELLAIQDED